MASSSTAFRAWRWGKRWLSHHNSAARRVVAIGHFQNATPQIPLRVRSCGYAWKKRSVSAPG